MGFIRNITMMIVGYIAFRSIQRVARNLEANLQKAKAPAPPVNPAVTKLKLDPITGVYKPEA